MLILNKIKQEKLVFQNFSYLALVDVFSLLVPFLSYPYLIKVIGSELYGLNITAQALVAYFSIVVNYGFNSVSARYISINRDNNLELSKIMSAIMTIRFVLWFSCFIVYVVAIYLFTNSKNDFLLFLYSFSFSLDYLLFPQFYFQGIEKMKYISLIKFVIKVVFLALIFVVIKDKSDYLLLPLINGIGCLIAGIFCFYIIYVNHALTFVKPTISTMKFYLKDATPIFLTDVVASIKDKWNYVLIGASVGTAEVVVYDIAARLQGILARPMDLMITILFPRMAKNRNSRLFIKLGLGLTALTAIVYIVSNFFLEFIVGLLSNNTITNILPIRLYLFSIVILIASKWIAMNLIVARGYNKYMLYTMILTCIVYLLALCYAYYFNLLNSVLTFVLISLLSYMVELVYRLFLTKKILQNEKNPSCF